MKTIILIIFLLASCNIASAQKHRIYGMIKDAESGEVLIGANIYDTVSLHGTVSSKDGFYSLVLTSPESYVVFSYVGYTNSGITLNKDRDTMINVFLTPGKELEEVRVKLVRENLSIYSVSKEQLMKTPVLGGEPDIMKYLQLLPGIQPGSEGTGNIHVRGGGPGENMVLLDRVPLYYNNHLGGFVSNFNPYIINDANVYTGNFPAEYGGRLSSVLDMTMKNGNKSKTKGEAGIGLISSKLAMDGPVNENLSYIFSARRTYLDLFLIPFFKLVSPEASMRYNFTDLNAKISYHHNDKNSMQISAYYGEDKLKFIYSGDGENYKMKHRWGNAFTSFQYKTILNSAIQVNNQLILSRYRLKTNHHLEFEEEQVEDNRFFYSGIKDIGIRSDWLINPWSFWDLKTGLHVFYHRYAPAEDGTLLIDKNSFFNIRDIESSLYFDNFFYVTQRFNVRGGIRTSLYKSALKTWFLNEPRLSARFHLNESISFVSAYSRMFQFIHQLKSTGNTLNPEIWIPVMKDLPPSMSDIFSAGIAWDMDDTYSLRIESYYKQLKDLVEYHQSELFISSEIDWYKQLEAGGKGTAYGIEFYLQKNQGRLTGSMSYSLSRSFRQFGNFNNGKVYPYNYDRPHSINVNMDYPLSKRLRFNAVWVFMSGLPITVPIGKQEVLNMPEGQIIPDDEVFIYSEKNAFRMKHYHRMDIAIHYIPKKRKRNSSWSFSVYNVYNRRNPLFYKFYFDSNENITIQEPPFIPIIPSFSYNVDF